MFKSELPLPASKSLYNRALIVQSYFPELKLVGETEAEDVVYLKKALDDWKIRKQNSFYIGEGGTTLRFLTLRLSRESGTFTLRGDPSLFKRPQSPLIQILSQLGVNATLFSDSLVIESKGWDPTSALIQVPHQESSQFLSSLFLSSWDLPFNLSILKPHHVASSSYFNLTLNFLSHLGLKRVELPNQWIIEKNQKPSKSVYEIEPDLSSASALLMAACLDGELNIPWPKVSDQPDRMILDVLKKMDVPYSLKDNFLQIKKVSSLQKIELNCEETPDLLPCLATLSCFAQGASYFSGLSRLQFKESQRLENTSQLLSLAGIKTHITTDSLTVYGQGCNFIPNDFIFDPSQDHRMAMAAALFKLKNPQVVILNPEVVKKSFPSFWSLLGINY